MNLLQFTYFSFFSSSYSSVTKPWCCSSNTVLFVCAFLFLIWSVQSEEECLKSKVLCYECLSTEDTYCDDPFNASIGMSSMIQCEGCCVKVLRNRNTPKQNIWRTCTTQLDINLFMVDHVCMEESNSQGHMCFCESDGCNSALSLLVDNRLQFVLLALAISFSGLLSISHQWSLFGCLFSRASEP